MWPLSPVPFFYPWCFCVIPGQGALREARLFGLGRFYVSQIGLGASDHWKTNFWTLLGLFKLSESGRGGGGGKKSSLVIRKNWIIWNASEVSLTCCLEDRFFFFNLLLIHLEVVRQKWLSGFWNYMLFHLSLWFLLQADDPSCCYSSNYYLDQKLHSITEFIFAFPFHADACCHWH